MSKNPENFEPETEKQKADFFAEDIKAIEEYTGGNKYQSDDFGFSKKEREEKEIKTENDEAIKFTEKLDKVSAEFGTDREKLIKCLEEKNLKDFFERIFTENKELLEDADFWIAAEILFDYYKNNLKSGFGDREFIVYKPSPKENQARFAISKNLAQKMKITGTNSDNCVYAKESRYEEDSLKNIFKEWMKEVYDLAFKELPAWFKKLEKIIDIDSVLYSYSPGDKKYIIDYAIDYVSKKKHSKKEEKVNI